MDDIRISQGSPPSTAQTYEQFQERRVFRALDGFRFISIIAVVWHHTQSSPHLQPILGRGFLGVDMFFTLSGFLIVTLLLRERERNGSIDLQKFHIRRALRIFPLYYAVLGLVVIGLLLKPVAGMAQPFYAELPYHLTLTSNWIHLTTFMSVAWSLATEAQFYLIWPPVEKFVKRPAAVLSILAVILVINQLINFHVLDPVLLAWIGPDFSKLEILQATFTPICLGVLLAHILNNAGAYRSLAKLVQANWAPLALMGATLLACNLPDFGAPLSWQRLLIQILMMLTLGSCVIHDGGWLSRGLNYAPIRRIGVISYGMYLLHMPARQAADMILQRLGLASPIALFFLCLVLTIAVSELSFRFYEMPFLKLKNLWGHRKPKAGDATV